MENLTNSISVEFLKNVPETLDDISRWLNKEFLVYNPGETVEMRKKNMWARANTDKIPFCMVALIDNKPVATASILENDLEYRKEYVPWLASVYTDVDYRGKGVGSFICQNIVKELFKLGKYKSLYLYTPDQMNFYKRLGWNPIENMEYMSKEITIMKIDNNL